MDKHSLLIGVVGIGHLGSLHAKMLAEMPSAQLGGLHDINATKASIMANELKTQSHSSIEEMFSRVEAVTIATPTRFHHEIARRAIEAGKHVFIEKPITQTPAEAQELIDLARKHKVKIQVGHIERFNPALLALEKYDLQPMFVESHRLAQFNPRGTDVAVVLDLMIHDIDIIISLVKSPIDRIEANGVAVVSDNVDIANARLQFRSGCVANVTASRISQKKMRKMRLFQRDAYISIDFSDGVAEVFRLVDENDSTPNTMMLGEIEQGTRRGKIIYEQPEVKEINALKYELESFIHSIQNDIEPMVTAEDGKQALEVAHAIMGRISEQTVVLR
jgi:predicted dehydrogenase